MAVRRHRCYLSCNGGACDEKRHCSPTVQRFFFPASRSQSLGYQISPFWVVDSLRRVLQSCLTLQAARRLVEQLQSSKTIVHVFEQKDEGALPTTSAVSRQECPRLAIWLVDFDCSPEQHSKADEHMISFVQSELSITHAARSLPSCWGRR